MLSTKTTVYHFLSTIVSIPSTIMSSHGFCDNMERSALEIFYLVPSLQRLVWHDIQHCG